MSSHAPTVQTVGAGSTTTGFGFTVEPDGVCFIQIYVMATDHASAHAGWAIQAFVRWDGGVGDAQLIGSADVVRKGTLGAATWAVTPTFTGHDVSVNVQGGIGQTVDWFLVNPLDPVCMTGVFVP